MKDDGGPAFPGSRLAVGKEMRLMDGTTPQSGMSLRDWFAGQALAGLLACGPHDCDERGLAHDAYLHADAMIAERAKEKTE